MARSTGHADVGEGMEVYAADGSRIGKVSGVYPAISEQDPGFDYPPETSTQVAMGNSAGEQLGLDVTGSVGPLTGRQPTQEEVGVDPAEGSAYSTGSSRDKSEDIGLADVGTDYKMLGEVPETKLSPGEANADSRDAEGYFQVSTGLDSTDLYVPLSAVRSIAGTRVTLDIDREGLNKSGWEHDPHSEQ